MNKDLALKISIILLIILVLSFISVIILYPDIKLKGSDITINYQEKYKEPGAYTTRFKRKIKITNNINYEKLGTYQVVYTYKLGFIKKSKKRNVTIVDKEKPTITLDGKQEIDICPNKTYEEDGYKAIDNYDNDITDKVKIDTKDDLITYTVSDSSGNQTSIERKINKIDKDNPKITLKGGSVTLYVNNKYNEPGYTASDGCDGDITKKVKVTNNINNKKAGTYYITYEVSDTSDNKVTVKRKVVIKNKVVSNPTPNNTVTKPSNNSGKKGVIYLTFDDGPSNYTSEILQILKKYNIKATFFVTGNGSDSMIKKEYDEGHTIGLHTYTHDYAKVYSSIDNYFADLQKVSDLVYKITNTKSHFIRFPGGSSNTVSKKYTAKIMTYLTKEVVNRGYKYYDWNVSSGDANSGCTTSSIYANVVNNLSKSRSNMVLMHDTKKATKDTLEKIIKYALNNGYQFLPITDSTPMVTHRIFN